MSLLYNAENAYGFPRGFKRKQQVVRKFQVGSIVKKKKKIYLLIQEIHETGIQSLGRKDPLEEEMASHSSILV